jgi:hypothetical protein
MTGVLKNKMSFAASNSIWVYITLQNHD